MPHSGCLGLFPEKAGLSYGVGFDHVFFTFPQGVFPASPLCCLRAAAAKKQPLATYPDPLDKTWHESLLT
jgi:hypothetical protein